MKKTFVTIFVVVALVLSSGINARAFTGSDIKVHTRASVASAFDTQELNNIAQNIYNFVPSSTNWLNASKVYSKINILPSSVSNYSHYVLVYTNSKLQILCFDGDSSTIFVNTGAISFIDTVYSANDSGTGNGYINIPVVNGGYSYSLYECSWSDSSQWSGQGYTSAASGQYYSLYYGGSIISTNIPMFFYEELNMNSIQHTGVTSSNLYAYPDLYNLLTDFAHVNLPYEDGDGNIVDPTPVIESNSNHMFFQNCDLGFCEPTGITNFTSFGGAYLYCKYSLDNWIVNHINEYQLQFNVVSAIGSEQNNFSYTMRVDRNGFVTVPFSSLFVSNSPSAIPINRGFAAVVSPEKLGSDYNIAHLYSVANSNVPNFVSDVLDAEYDYNLTDLGWSALKGGVLKYIVAWVDDGGTISMNNISNWAEGVTQSFNPYILRVEVKLISGSDQSSGYAEKFDLYTGDQSTVDTGGLVNPDPFVPDVDQGDGDLPSAPQDPNSTTPGYNIVPSGYWQGTMNAIIGYDPGYRDLKADLDKDPDDNFTQYLAPFKNNEVGGFVGDFLDDMPTALKSIFIGGFGVLTLLGIYRFIRRG